VAKIKLTLSDVLKKHIRIVAYLSVSALLGYALSLLTNKPEAIYLTPIINYVLYAIAEELKKEGFVKVLKG